MTRWIMIALTATGLMTAILTRSPGLLGLALLLTLVGLFGTVISLAADRISENSRPDSTMLSPDVLMAVRERSRTPMNRESGRTESDAAGDPRLGTGQS